MHTRSAFLTFLILTLGGLCLVASINALVDPYQILHRPLWGQALFSSNQRFQNAGLINSYLEGELGYDGIIVGTSLDDCYNVGQIREKLGVSGVLNLAIDSSLPRERGAILRRALGTGAVRYALVGLYENYADTKPDRENPAQHFPYELYHPPLSLSGLGGVIHYLLNATVFKESMILVAGRSGWTEDLATAYHWTQAQLKSRSFDRFNSPDRLRQHASSVAQGKDAIRQAQWGVDRARSLDFPALDKHLVSEVLANPGVRFDLVFPPVSVLNFHMLSAEALLRQIGLRFHVVQALGNAPNVRIFAFDDDWAVTENLAHYRDPFHVYYKANDRVVDKMSMDMHRLTPENVDAYVAGLLDRFQNYSVISDKERSEAELGAAP